MLVQDRNRHASVAEWNIHSCTDWVHECIYKCIYFHILGHTRPGLVFVTPGRYARPIIGTRTCLTVTKNTLLNYPLEGCRGYQCTFVFLQSAVISLLIPFMHGSRWPCRLHKCSLHSLTPSIRPLSAILAASHVITVTWFICDAKITAEWPSSIGLSNLWSSGKLALVSSALGQASLGENNLSKCQSNMADMA